MLKEALNVNYWVFVIVGKQALCVCVCVKECARTHNYIFPVACSDAFYRPHPKAVLAKDLVCTSDTVPQLFDRATTSEREIEYVNTCNI